MSNRIVAVWILVGAGMLASSGCVSSRVNSAVSMRMDTTDDSSVVLLSRRQRIETETEHQFVNCVRKRMERSPLSLRSMRSTLVKRRRGQRAHEVVDHGAPTVERRRLPNEARVDASDRVEVLRIVRAGEHDERRTGAETAGP